MIIYNDEDEIMFNRLQSALAKLDAAFTARDYHLSKRQNTALNEILDISLYMAQKNPRYKKEVEAARAKANEERKAAIEEMVKNGIL